jgi:glutamate---cysteine ligase / carboxylate-amine ligase
VPGPPDIPDAAALRRRFDAVGGFTVGVEEETMLLDPETFDLAPVARPLLARLEGDSRFKLELPAAQLEILTASVASVPAAVAQLAAARRDLAAAAAGLARPAVAGVHPFAAGEGILNTGGRYDTIAAEYASVARRQLVASLQVHVAVGGADRSLAVYDALRCHLPELAALAANAPFYEGADSGLASVRPGICVQLPRQGVPPPIESWEQFAAELGWGRQSGTVPEVARWWWELRPHPRFGTLELRVPDAQTTVAEAAGVIAFIQALAATLAERHDAGEPLPAAPSWRINENRWSAARHGVEGELVDLATGRRRPTRERLAELVEEVEPAARGLGGAELLDQTRASIERNGAIRQREAAAEVGVRGLPAWLAEQFLAEAEL